jgi:hypothetical protein
LVLRGMLVAALFGYILHVMTLSAGAQIVPVIDPDVRGRVDVGRARALVELQVGEAAVPEQRAEAIARAQEAVMSRLPRTHATLVRRYTSIPMLTLEIDATALRALETMTEIVAAVKLDRAMKPQ